jgi:hypothetical protein
MLRLDEYSKAKGSIYTQFWVLQYSDEVPQPAFNIWQCKALVTSTLTKEIKALPNFEAIYLLNESLIKIGNAVSQNNAPSHVNQTIKNMCSELIPAGEELTSVLTSEQLSIKTLVQFLQIPPDITLEKELCWPVEPDLQY